MVIFNTVFETACMIIATMSIGDLVNNHIRLKANQDVKALSDLMIKRCHFFDQATKTTTIKSVFACKVDDYLLVKKAK